jgi:D-serine deaminase-like pyridoxal phosphate-dependent protein
MGGLAGLSWLKPGDRAGPHSDYFIALGKALDAARIARPTLIVDRQRLLENIHTLKRKVIPQYHYRMVVKSLPALPLLDLVAEQTGSRRFMAFDERFVLKLLQRWRDADILLGKPLPTVAVNRTLAQLSKSQGSGIRWLVDSQERLHEYRILAQQRRQHLRINLELDIGLHRGGFRTAQQLGDALRLIGEEPLLEFDGFMGYEPHVVKLPGDPNRHLDAALTSYREHIDSAREMLGADFPAQPVLNSAGSPSYPLHTHLPAEKRVANELSAGSCLVKPLDFDLPTLADHVPACFIATPILKTSDTTEIPGLPGLGAAMAWWDPNLAQSLFTYGGNWKARPVSPAGLTYHPVYGRSSNQEMLNFSTSMMLKLNDWVFLRPTQSEAVFLQFGDIAVFEGGTIVDAWPTLTSS